MNEPAVDTGPTWDVWVDTGGTFTDCLARISAPGRNANDLRRAKVLSTSALRGRIVRKLDGASFEVNQNWNACDDLIAGFSLFIPGQHGTEDQSPRVLWFNAARSIVKLDRPIRGEVSGAMFEVRCQDPAPILAARLVTQTPANRALPHIRMRLATTRGTNALLERRGAPIALFITQGFADLLVIGDQQRPELFALKIERPAPLYAQVSEIRHRIDADGAELIPLDEDHLCCEARRLFDQGIRLAAVAIMHSHAFPEHEVRVAKILREVGFVHVSCSSQLAPLIRILPRASTAVVDAYLSPIVRDYLQSVQRNGLQSLHVMTSAGGLFRANAYRACDSLLSGPAGGIVGAAEAGRRSGFSKVIGFDMGGTSTDVARFDGDFEFRFEQNVAGVRVFSPALNIETVASGGGSICAVVDDRLVVGPQSAGASPGPACYGTDGPLTITDVNLVLGRLVDSQFEIPIQPAAAATALADCAAQLREASTQSSIEALGQGFLEIANQRMSAAIEAISVRRGFDPAEYALIAFGGAGGQHGCAIAERLGMTTVMMPADASLLSALGLGCASVERFVQRQVLALLDDCLPSIAMWIDELAAQAIAEVAREGIRTSDIAVRRVLVHLRLLGQDATLPIELKDGAQPADLELSFRARFQMTYGHDLAERGDSGHKPIEVESIRLAAASIAAFDAPQHANTAATPFYPGANRHQRGWFDGGWRNVPVFDRDALAIGARIDGPALVVDRRTTLVIESGWHAEVNGAGAVVARVTHVQQTDGMERLPRAAQLELFSHRFASIADDMGQMLQRTALSTNVKERLDFSCAVLNPRGELVANAPHIPVHLGALGMCVRSVAKKLQLKPGDVAITNHPAYGGSHLPDVTVITPVFHDAAGETLIGYVASRAHHAEIGGSRPGSMPPNARCLAEEGVVIPPRLLVARGKSRLEETAQLLRSGPYPSRAVGDNVADLRAMIAANQRGGSALQLLTNAHGVGTVQNQMAALADRAERFTRAALQRLPQQSYQARECLDDGSPIQVAIEIRNDFAIIDFKGSLAAAHPGNLNATPAIVQSAVIYVLRLLIGEQLPLNEGMMRAVEIRIPTGMLNPCFVDDPTQCPAVVGGNTETSQRIVDTLIKAFGLAACSQGTMNNVLFGNEQFGYYETVCGGAGAGPGFDGCSAVHTHMTNTRITDPEIVEHRYSVRIDRFAIRAGSGGAGTYRGGDGTVRAFTFLRPMSLSILSQHRQIAPYGLCGGGDGACGRQQIVLASGEVVPLAPIDGVDVDAGDQLVLETPGGGGYGAVPPTSDCDCAPGKMR